MSTTEAELRPGESQQSTYRVGYGRPPKAYRFPKGHSGNLEGGRAHKKLTLQGALDDVLADPIVVRANGRERKMSTLEGMLWKQMQAALRGNTRALRYILNLIKRTSRFAALEEIVGVYVYEDRDSQDAKDLFEYRELKAAGKDPWDYIDPQS